MLKKQLKSCIRISARLRDRAKQEIVFGVDGMSCFSCSLFLGIVLSRNIDIIHSSIDFKTKIGTVDGYLNRAEVFKII